MDHVARFIEQLNLSQPGSLVGGYFPQVVHWVALLFGVNIIFFAKKNIDFYLLISGLLIGAWLGVSIKDTFTGVVNPVFYMVGCSLLCAYAVISFKRVTGMIVGAFLAIIAVFFISDNLMSGSGQKDLVYLLSAIAGMFAGTLAPATCIAIAFSLIGASFVSFGLGNIIIVYFRDYKFVSDIVLINMVIFLPAFITGVIYNLFKQPPSESSGKEGKKKRDESDNK